MSEILKMPSTLMGQDRASAMKLGSDNVDQYKAIIFHLASDLKRKQSMLVGVQALSEQLESKESECKFFKSKVEQFEVLLARAENRLAQLSLQSGKGPQAARGITTIGVSKKVLESLTRENTKLKLALQNVVNRGPESVNLAEENLDLSNMVVALREELQQTKVESEELRGALRAVETEDTMQLQEQVAKLTGQLTISEKHLNAKQVFCESVVAENQRLKVMLDSLKSERITQVTLLRNELGSLAEKSPELKSIMDRVWDGPQDSVDGDREMFENKIHGLEHLIMKHQERIELQQQENEQLRERIAIVEQEFAESSEVNKTYEEQLRLFQEQTEKQLQELQRQKQELEALEFEKTLMQDQLQNYENDFKIERQEKQKAVNDLKGSENIKQKLERQLSQVQSENQYLQQLVQAEVQRRQQYHQQQQPPKAKTPSPPPQTQQYRPFEHCAPQNTPWNAKPNATQGFQGGIVVTDGPTRLQFGHPSPRPSPTQSQAQRQARQAPESINRLQCPICKNFFPYDIIEEHLTDCQERRELTD